MTYNDLVELVTRVERRRFTRDERLRAAPLCLKCGIRHWSPGSCVPAGVGSVADQESE